MKSKQYLSKLKSRLPYEEGLMIKVLAHHGEQLVGTGWITYREDGSFGQPEIMGIDGQILEPGWYNVKVTGESHLVIIPRKIQ
jgi:hypothetical protein